MNLLLFFSHELGLPLQVQKTSIFFFGVIYLLDFQQHFSFYRAKVLLKRPLFFLQLF